MKESIMISRASVARTARRFLLLAWLSAAATLAQAQGLPSWNDGAAKQAILRFVSKAATQARMFQADRTGNRSTP